MIDKLIHFCLTNKLVVLLVVLFAVLWGVMVAPFDWDVKRLPRDPVPVDAIPDIGENQQIVFTRWMGRSPQDMEDQVTYPLTSALLGIPGVKTVRSYSMFGFSTIYIIFKEDVEFYWSRSRVLEKLNSLPADALPDGVQPALGPDATALGQVYWYTLEGRDRDGNPTGGWDLNELRSIQDWYVRYALLSADGVSEVASVGGFVQEYQIDVDPDAMRAHGVTLDEVFMAVKLSNLDVGARTIEINKAEYVIRGLGFIRHTGDIENSVVKVNDNVPIYVKNVARVSLGPALRRGVLDKGGAEVVGGVVVVRYGENPLAAIKSVKEQIARLSPGLPEKAVIDYEQVTKAQVRDFAEARGFEAYRGAALNQDAWQDWLKQAPAGDQPAWVTLSKVTVVPFYDRTGLIYETLGTLNTAIAQQILVTIIVIIVMVMHLRSSMVIGATLPLAVLMCFIAMKVFGVDANIVALSGIAIAIGTIVDMGVIVCENVLRHLAEAPAKEDRLAVVYRAASEVGSAVLTAVLTTIVSFLPVFTMIGAEGKLFKPLAFTKTFALFASVIVALTIVPALAHWLFPMRFKRGRLRRIALIALIVAGVAVAIFGAWWAGVILICIGLWHLTLPHLPERIEKILSLSANYLVAFLVGLVLTRYWLPLGPQAGFLRNAIVVLVPIFGLLAFFTLFARSYGPILRWCLDHKWTFIAVPIVTVLAGLYVWLGPGALFGLGRLNRAPSVEAFGGMPVAEQLQQAGLIAINKTQDGAVRDIYWSAQAMDIEPGDLEQMLARANVPDPQDIVDSWQWRHRLNGLARKPWEQMRGRPLTEKLAWTLARDWNGRGKEFMPPLDEGSFLYMPTTMPHASIGEAQDVLRKQDMAFLAIPEIDSAVGKLGRADTPLDPAPISMIETVIEYKPKYQTDRDGRLVLDDQGRVKRLWREGIETPQDIWDEIVRAAAIPGVTGAPKLQPIQTRLVMLQTGMRAPMGVKVKGHDLAIIEEVGLRIEELLKQVEGVETQAVFADRIIGKPYLEIHIDRKAIARYGLRIDDVQTVIEIAIGGRPITMTVEGRERYPVRVRYPRELRNTLETLGGILVPAPGGEQIPLRQLATIEYTRGPQSIKSEDTFLVGYVLFDKEPGYAEVDVVRACQAHLAEKLDPALPAGIHYEFAGTYEHQVRAQKTLAMVIPAALLVIFLILYLQFGQVSTTLLVFGGVFVAWSGGFVMLWLYGRPWFLDFSVLGVPLRELFSIHPYNLSVAVWVGFLALFGIATDDGVLMTTYLNQRFEAERPGDVEAIRRATIAAAAKRVRPALMTSATTILALLPVLTSTGRGSDIMVPMAIPSFGGMSVAILTILMTPVLYCAIQEWRHRRQPAS